MITEGLLVVVQDVEALGEALKDATPDTVEAALEAYQMERLEKANDVVLAVRQVFDRLFGVTFWSQFASLFGPISGPFWSTF